MEIMYQVFPNKKLGRTEHFLYARLWKHLNTGIFCTLRKCKSKSFLIITNQVRVLESGCISLDKKIEEKILTRKEMESFFSEKIA